MGRICGYISKYNRPERIKTFLSECYPLTKPDSLEGSYFSREDVALCADGGGCYAEDKSKRYICVVDGNTFADKDILEKIGQESNLNNSAQVILKYYLHEGLEAFGRLPASFVFAIWDTEMQKLILGRDRYGVKRIYYSKTSDGFYFSSNLSSMVKILGSGQKINMNGFIEYMTYGFVIPPNTIYENILTLNPGEYLTFENERINVDCFHNLIPKEWNFHDTENIPENELIDKMDQMLIDSVRRRIPSAGDVGAYLSSGLDASLVCSIIKNHTDKNVIAYTLGSKDPMCDEVPDAKEIATHLGIKDHHGYYIQKEDFLDALYSLPEIYGQPFGDISAIPNYIIAKRVAQDHDSVVTGDGPDFMYGGIDFRKWNLFYKWIPQLLRLPISKILTYIFHTFYKGWVSPNIHISELLTQPEFFWIFHKKFKSHELERLIQRKVDPNMFWLRNYFETTKYIPPYERFRHAFFLIFGTHGVLCKGTDIHDTLRLNFICPYYDPDLFDFVQYLPTEYKFRDGKGKYLHKQLLFRYIPRDLLERPKHGFIINYNEFGLDLLRDLTNKYLSRKKLSETGLINTEYALQCVEGYYNGDPRMGPLLWTLLIFEMWRDKFSISA